MTDADYDLDGDNTIGPGDMLILLQAMKEETAGGDFNCDSVTNGEDMLLLTLKWGIVVSP
jgi:hypothetical protein